MGEPLVKPRVEAHNLPLNEKQKRFAVEFVIDLNATQAATRAGYSARSAAAQGARLLRDARIIDLIQKEKDARAKRTEISADRVLEEYARIAYQDPRVFYKDDGTLKPIHELDDGAAALVSGFDRFGNYKTWSKENSLDALSKNLGLFEKHNLQQQVNIFPPEVNKPKDSGK